MKMAIIVTKKINYYNSLPIILLMLDSYIAE